MLGLRPIKYRAEVDVVAAAAAVGAGQSAVAVVAGTVAAVVAAELAERELC